MPHSDIPHRTSKAAEAPPERRTKGQCRCQNAIPMPRHDQRSPSKSLRSAVAALGDNPEARSSRTTSFRNRNWLQAVASSGSTGEHPQPGVGTNGHSGFLTPKNWAPGVQSFGDQFRFTAVGNFFPCQTTNEQRFRMPCLFLSFRV